MLLGRACLEKNTRTTKLQYNPPGSTTCKYCTVPRGTGPFNNSIEVIVCHREVLDQQHPCLTLNLANADKCLNNKCQQLLPHGMPPAEIISMAKYKAVWSFKIKARLGHSKWICRFCGMMNAQSASWCTRDGCGRGETDSAFFVIPLWGWKYSKKRVVEADTSLKE